jgi:hypothetical protein
VRDHKGEEDAYLGTRLHSQPSQLTLTPIVAQAPRTMPWTILPFLPVFADRRGDAVSSHLLVQCEIYLSILVLLLETVGGAIRQILRIVFLSRLSLLRTGLLPRAFGLLGRSSIFSSSSSRALTLRSSLGWLLRRVSVAVIAAGMILACSDAEIRDEMRVTHWYRPPSPCFKPLHATFDGLNGEGVVISTHVLSHGFVVDGDVLLAEDA